MTIHIIKTKRATSYIKAPLYIIIYGIPALLSILAMLILNLFLITPTHADSLTYSVTIDPSLTISIPTNLVRLNLNPVSNHFASENLGISVSTNNATGYYMTMSTLDNSTHLVNDNNTPSDSSDDYYIETLPSTGDSSGIDCSNTANGCTESNFLVNRWGYKLGTSNYLPFTSGATIADKNTPVVDDNINLTFASKVDYDTVAGLYSTILNFTATTKPVPVYMQYMTPAACTTTPRLVTDIRDNQEYYVARLADGKCWMIQNLRLGQNLETTTGSMTLTSEDSNVASDFILTNKRPGESVPSTLIQDGTYKAYIYDASAFLCKDEYGCYYNWYTATASSGTSDQTTSYADMDYSICPAGWVLPTGGLETSPHNSDFRQMVNTYGYEVDPIATVLNRLLVDPTNDTTNTNGASIPGFTLGGYYLGKSYLTGQSAEYWSSTNYSKGFARPFQINFSNNYISLGNYQSKADARSVRCLLQE